MYNPTGALSSLISARTRQLTAQGTLPVLFSLAKHTDSPVWWVKTAPTATCFAYSVIKATAVLQEKEVHQQEPLSAAKEGARSHSVSKDNANF